MSSSSMEKFTFLSRNPTTHKSLRFRHFFILILKLVYCQLSHQQQMQINPNAENTDPITGFQNPFRRQRLDTDAIVVQRRNFAVTTYHLMDDPNGHPIFTRPLKDRGKKFIFFNNPSFPQGSGHYIVLRKMDGQNRQKGIDPAPMSAMMMRSGNPVNQMPQFLYETFTLSFKDSLSGSVTDLDPFQYKAVKMRTGTDARKRANLRARLRKGARKRGRGGPFRSRGRTRGKRETPQDYEAVWPASSEDASDFTHFWNSISVSDDHNETAYY